MRDRSEPAPAAERVSPTALFGIGLPDAMALAQRAAPTGRPFRLVALRQQTIELLEPFLKLGGLGLGLDLDIAFGGFDRVMPDIFASDLWETPAQAALLNLDPARIAPELAAGRGDAAAIEEIVDRVVEMVGALHERAQAPVLLLGLEAPLSIPGGVAESRGGQGGARAAFRRVNALVDARISEAGQGYVVDLAGAVERLGRERFFDIRKTATHAMPLTPAGARECAIEITKYLRNIASGPKKVVVLDCDDTLWRGLAGEEGPDAVGLTASAWPDAGHLRLQAYVKSLIGRGVLVALASKNEPESVWSVFDGRREMILTREDVSAARINWGPKASNLQSLAEELNLGVDSFVFIDDNPAEIEAMRQALPQVDCLHASPANLVDLPERIEAAGWFEAARVTRADAERSQRYVAERRRKETRTLATDMEGYLASLEMAATLRVGAEIDVARAAQMCQRTNQFNLTTERHDLSAIRSFIDRDDAWIATLALRDKFGDLGDIALAIAEQDADEWRVNTLLLSCRAFDRRCEQLLLHAIEREGAARWAAWLVGRYRPTERNKLVAGFWEGCGLEVVRQDAAEVVSKRRISGARPASLGVFAKIEVSGSSGGIEDL